MSATINRMPTTPPASFQIAQSNNPTNNGKPTDLGKGEIQGVGPDGKVYKTQLILRIKDGSGESQYYANGKALPKNLSEAEAKVYVRQQISKGTLGALEPGNKDAFKTKNGMATPVGNTNKQRRSSETMEQAVKNNRIPPGTAVITLDKLVSGLQQPSKDFSLGEAFWGTESGKIKGALHMGAISINRDTDERIKNPGFHYDEKTRSVYFANSQDGAQAYVNFMRKFSEFSTDGSGKYTKAAEKFMKEGLPQLTDQFGPKMMAGFKQVEKNQAAFQKGLDDSGLTTLGKIQTGLDIVGEITGRPVPVARPGGRKAMLTAKTPFGNVPSVASKTVRNNPNNSNTPRQISPTKPTGIGTNGTVLTPPKVQTKPVSSTPPVVTGQNGSTNPIKNTSAERPYKPIPQVAPLIPSKPTGTGFGTSTLRTTLSKVKATAPTTPATPAPVTSRSDWSFGSIKVNKPAVKPSNAPVATPQTRVIDPFDAKNSIPGATPAPGGNNVVPIKRKATSGDGTVQGKPGGTPGIVVGNNPNDPTAATAETAGSKTPNKPGNPGGTATATLEAPAAQRTTAEESQAVPVLGEVTTPPLLKPNTVPAGQPEVVPVPIPMAKPLLKPLPGAKPETERNDLPLAPLNPGAKPNTNTVATPGSTPSGPVSAITTSNDYTYEPSQYLQTDYNADIAEANRNGGTGNNVPTDKKAFYFLDLSPSGSGKPMITETRRTGRAQELLDKKFADGSQRSFYIGRFEKKPVAVILEKQIIIASPPQARSVLQMTIKDRADFQKIVTEDPAGAGTSQGIVIPGYNGKDLAFRNTVSTEQGALTARAVATKLGEVWANDAANARLAFTGGDSIGGYVSAGDINGYGASVANNAMDRRLNDIKPDGTTQIITDVKQALKKDRALGILRSIPDTVANVGDGNWKTLGAAIDRTVSATVRKPAPAIGLGVGASVLYTFGTSRRANDESADIATKPAAPAKEGEKTLSEEIAQLGLLRARAKQFDSEIDNPGFEMNWAKDYGLKRATNNDGTSAVTVWKPELYAKGAPKSAGQLQSEAKLFYKNQADTEAAETTRVAKLVFEVAKAKEIAQIVAKKGTVPAVEDLKANQDYINGLSYSLGQTTAKYKKEEDRFDLTITSARQATAENTQIEAKNQGSLPAATKIQNFTSVDKKLDSILKSNAQSAETARVKAAQLPRPGGGVSVTSKEALVQQENVIVANSKVQRQLQNLIITQSDVALKTIEKSVPAGQRLPTNLVAQADKFRTNRQSAIDTLTRIDTNEIALKNAVNDSYNKNVGDQRAPLIAQATNISKKIELADRDLSLFKTALEQAQRQVEGTGLKGLATADNLEATGGIFKLKQSVINELDETLTAVKTRNEAGLIVEVKGKELRRDTNGKLVPARLNATKSTITSFKENSAVEIKREKLRIELEGVQAKISRLDQGGKVSPTPQNTAPEKPQNRSNVAPGGGAQTSSRPQSPAVDRTAEQDALKKKS